MATTAPAIIPNDQIRLEDSKDDLRVEHIDSIGKAEMGVKLDKFGAAPKSDPAEIALVKKLDLFIMVRCIP